MAISEIYQAFKNRFDEALLTPTGRVVVTLAITFVVATFIFGLLIYSFSRPPAKKQTQVPVTNLPTTTPQVTTPIEITTLPTSYPNINVPDVLAAVEKDSKLLEANDLEGFYNNLAKSIKKTVSYQNFNVFLTSKFGGNFKIITARRATDPVFTNNTAQVDIIITYQVSQSTKQTKSTFYYINENGLWKLNLIT